MVAFFEKIDELALSGNLFKFSRSLQFIRYLSLRKIPKFLLTSCCESFVETHSFLRVSGYSVKTLRKHCVSSKFPHKEIRWNSGISCSVSCIFYLKNLFNTIKAIHITNSKIDKQEAPTVNPKNPPMSANISLKLYNPFSSIIAQDSGCR